MQKRFGIFIPSDAGLHIEGLRAFADGLRSRGLSHEVYRLEDGYQSCDIAVTFGIHKKRTPRGQAVGQVIEQHTRLHGLNQNIVVERGFIHRDRYFMVGWGGLNGRANFCNRRSPHDRLSLLRVAIAPWRTVGHHLVLCGQIPWDAAVQDSEHAKWCHDTAVELARLTSRPILFRPHPLQPNAIDLSSTSVQLSTQATLQEDMVNAWAVITFNSNASVEATIAGIPAFVADPGAMGYSILNRSLADIEQPRMPERMQWLADLAYTQWTLDEIAEGKAIYHLFEKQYPRLLRWWRSFHRTRKQIRSKVEHGLGGSAAAA